MFETNEERHHKDEIDDLPLAAELRAGVDLRTLLGEMSALRVEVRKETQASRDLRDKFAEALGLSEKDAQRWRQEAERSTATASERLLDIADRLEVLEGLGRRLASRTRGFGPWKRSDPELMGLHEAMLLTCSVVADILRDRGLSKIQSLGQPFDSSTMTALAIRNEPRSPDGVVVQEIKAGYWGPKGVHRYCQVVVNRKDSKE
jgi:molecular chaperone GrpE (heat shock protein)